MAPKIIIWAGGDFWEAIEGSKIGMFGGSFLGPKTVPDCPRFHLEPEIIEINKKSIGKG